jgi:hypothetical protein
MRMYHRKEIVPPSVVRDLTNLLINKLSGNAHAFAESARYEIIIQLDILIRAFSQLKSAEEYRGQLFTTYLARDESILKYMKDRQLLRDK